MQEFLECLIRKLLHEVASDCVQLIDRQQHLSNVYSIKLTELLYCSLVRTGQLIGKFLSFLVTDRGVSGQADLQLK